MRCTTVVLGVLLLSACGAQQPADRLVAAEPSPTGGLPPVVRDGDVVTATGRVVQVPGSPVRLCAAPEFVADVGYEPGSEPPPRRCEQGVDLEGADLAALTDRRERAGAVEGFATVTGVLRGRTVVVREQTAPAQAPRPQPDVLRSVPCPAPPGGWPRDPGLLLGPGQEPEGDVDMERERPALDAYRTSHPDDVVDVVLRRPFPDSVVQAVLASDEQARQDVEQALRPAYGTRLCVVVSRYSRAQVDAADADLSLVRPERSAQGVYAGGTTFGDDLQPRLELEVVRMTDELAAAVARHPAGLVHVRPWLVAAR